MAGITINSNIWALRAQTRLGTAEAQLSVALERLSSGQRITRASDDAAGLAIASKLQTSSRIYSQAIRNGSDAISLLNVAQSATDTLMSILQRQKELAAQAANGALSLSQRQSLQRESMALVDEYNRVIGSTKFNKRELLSGTLGHLVIQLGSGSQSTLGMNVGEGLERSIFDDGFDEANISTGLGYGYFAIGDIDSDGDADIIASSGSVKKVSYNDGAGTFTAAVTLLGPTGGEQLELVDVNGDGKNDLLAWSSDGYVHISTGKGDGTFNTSVSYSSGLASIADLQIADVNSDGNLDFITTSTKTTGISVMFGSPSGNYSSKVQISSTANFKETQIGDINGDGSLDIVASNNTSAAFHTFLGNGSGSFSTGGTFSAGASASSERLKDVNFDGKLDLMEAGGNILRIRLGRGDGTFDSAVTIGTGFTSIVDVRDFDGDGKPDLVTSYSSGSNAYVKVLTGNGDGTFNDAVTYLGGNASGFTVNFEDVNGDGVDDMSVGGGGVGVITVGIARTTEVTSIPYLDILTVTNARATLDLLEEFENRVTTERSNIGSYLARQEAALNNLSSARVYTAEASDRITSADIAMEAANMTRMQILQSAATAVLAQATLVPQLALQLLTSAGVT